MKAFDVVGWANTEGWYCICVGCKPAFEMLDLTPIFACSEWDTEPSCDNCLCPIEGVIVIGGQNAN